MSEQAKKETGYEAMRDMGDCVRALIPARTEVTLQVVGFALDLTGGLAKAHIVGKFDVVGPEEFADYGVFTRRYYLGNTPAPGKRADQTAFHMSRREWCKILAAILNAPPTDNDVRFFFADVQADPAADLATYFDEITAKLNTLTGQSFVTKIGVETDKTGQYDPKQVVGNPVFPSEAEAAQARVA